jgi:hypothetical protein
MKRRKDDPLADPLSWRPVKAPSLAEMEVIAVAAYEKLPKKFRELCDGVIIHIDDFRHPRVIPGRRAAVSVGGCTLADPEHGLAISSPDP